MIKDIKGDLLNNKNIKSIRPSFGLHPKFLPKFLGKKSKINIKFGSRVKWELIKKNLAFKISANNTVGLGHLIRCIKIAKHIKKKI